MTGTAGTYDFSGRTALITGGTRGAGLGTAEAFLAAGANVVITGRDQARVDTVVQRLADRHGYRVDGIKAHVALEDDRHVSLGLCLSKYGSVDILFNNAAVNPHVGPCIDIPTSAADKIMQVNVLAPLGYIQQAWDMWMRDNGGVVINHASISGWAQVPPVTVYGASKAALIYLTQALGAQLAPRVRVNAIAPGTIETGFADWMYQGREEESASYYPMGRHALPSDIAQAALWLASEQSTYITGAVIPVDGGMMGYGYPDPYIQRLGRAAPDRHRP
ncbi:SDR family oxidoreductase [Streptomyces noursei]|uniref:3-ketoacyl-ACP reductase n=1 Tax=Streptomyces noursei TaxID=1971 RepID=A0A401QUJ5_STRNR|nr:SDR family oxidoreductase [Streptomyces noursei]EOT01601.1 hypothetical protein K530_22982 [Streptomyces noursei CCRC 11814]UWS77018.1 SDR family oxidoreductase [Streptomyces noursei]GCB89081.1 3-ketoacyl-ACP reductase [Streptomyces noursei]